jgi:ribosomal-protein-alanine N-acetyltransferase
VRSGPDLQIAGSKIRLVGPALIDAEDLLELRYRNKATWGPVSPPAGPLGYELDFQEKGLRDLVKQWRRQRDYVFGVLNEDGKLIGQAGIENVYLGAYRSANIGFLIDQAQTGHGYATEAVQLLLGFAFDRLMLRRVQAGVLADNAPSIRVLTKCGFEREGVARDFLHITEGWSDHVIYAITRPKHVGRGPTD